MFLGDFSLEEEIDGNLIEFGIGCVMGEDYFF